MKPKRKKTIHVDAGKDLAEARADAVEAIEKHYLAQLLFQYDGRIDRTAAAAGISTRQLRKLLHKHNIRKESFKPARRPRKGIGSTDS